MIIIIIIIIIMIIIIIIIIKIIIIIIKITHGHHIISNDRAPVNGVACQPNAASRVDRRVAGDLRYKLGLDHCFVSEPCDFQIDSTFNRERPSVVWPVLVWCGWIYAARGPSEQHSSEFAEYDPIVYLGCRARGCCQSRFCTPRRFGWRFWQHLMLETFGIGLCWINCTRQFCRWGSHQEAWRPRKLRRQCY